MTLHPTLQAAIGRDVRVTYREARGVVVDGRMTTSQVEGELDVVGNRDGVPTDLAIATDGAVALIPIGLVLGLVEL